MVGRFKVRPDGDGYGVWDGAANGWRARDLTEREAHRAAADLEVQYDAYGVRPAETVRQVQPPRPVERVMWLAGGVVEAWVRQREGWYGLVRASGGQLSWVPGNELRPMPGGQSEGA